ncbi:MAG TPA: MFS transporter [Ktedonobacterales bacterium]|nr:MFS transporter [Ktedonobacterales bacterium]
MLLDRLGWRRFGRDVWLLLLFTLGKGFQLSIGAVTINLYVYSLGYKQDFVGLFVGMSALGGLLMAVPAGMLSDKLGHKPVLLLTGILTPLSLVAIAFSTSVPALLVTGFLNGVVASFYWVTVVPMLADSLGENERVGALAMNSFLLLGLGSLGSLVGGFVPELAAAALNQHATAPTPLRLGILAAVVIVALTALPLFWLRSPRRQKDTAHAGQAQPELQQEAESQAQPAVARRAPVALFAMLLIPDMIITFGEGIVVGLLQLFFFLKFGLQPGALGGLFTIAGILGGLGGLFAPLVVKRWGKLRTTTSLQLATAPIMLLTGFAPWLPLAASGEYMRTLMRALIDPVYAAFALEQLPEKYRAAGFGFYSVTWGLGYSLGPALGGWLQVQVGLSAGFVVGAFCMLLAPSLLLAFFGRRTR